MANLPDKSEMIGNSVTEAQFKQKLGVLLDNVASKDEVDTKKTEAIDAASEDATSKANNAETNAKNYADLERSERKSLIDSSDNSLDLAITDKYGFSSIQLEDRTLKIFNVAIEENDSSIEHIFADKYGFSGVSFGETGFNLAGLKFQVIEQKIESSTIPFVDKHGFAVTIENASSHNDVGFSDDYIRYKDARALAYSAKNKFKDHVCAKLKKGINLVILYGQSLSDAAQGVPALSTVSKFPSLLMVGNSVRSVHYSFTDTFIPMGALEFKPLVATNTTSDAIVAYNDVDYSTHRGEDLATAAVNMLKAEYNNMYNNGEDDPDVKIVVVALGHGARNIASLSKGASPALYNRITDCATKVKALATAQSLAFHHVATIFAQGEQDYADGTPTATYKSTKLQLINDIYTDVTLGIIGQTEKALWLDVQAGASFTNDTNNLGIANSIIELAEEQNAVTAVTGYAHVTDRNGHLTPNGYRQISCMIGKALINNLLYRKRTQTFKLLTCEYKDDEVLLTFDVPQPPLKFAQPYVQFTKTDYAQKGFVAKDSVGSIPLTASIVGDASILLKLSHVPIGALTIFCGDKAVHNGSVCLKDSDDTVSPYVYEYLSKDDPNANIAELVNKPYDLANWVLAFTTTSTEITNL